MKLVILSIVSCLSFFVNSQNTVGLIEYEAGNKDGYLMFSPIVSTETYLIDKCGEKVHEWTASTRKPGLSAFILQDGSLLRTGQLDNLYFDEGGSGGIIERFDWEGNLIWSYSISDSLQCQHHDIMPLANGNILCIVWDKYTKEEAITQGAETTYPNASILSEKIIELQPIGTDNAAIVWEWKLWDHLVQDFDASKPNFGVVADNPGLININYFPSANNTTDWIHLNSIDYNEDLDQILVSSHTFSEVWIIDHSTTTVEAGSHTGGNAGKGGDLLYRWGNPQTYQRGNPTTKKFYGQHHATWIPNNYPNAGKILVFNNGLSRPGTFSSVDMIDPPLNGFNYDLTSLASYSPSDLFWTYTATTPSDFYSSNISGVYPLDNGSFMVTSGTSGLFFEIDALKQKKWSYVSPVSISGLVSQGVTPSNNLVFRSNFYNPDFPGFSGKDLTQKGAIELNPISPSICDLLSSNPLESKGIDKISVYPNPVIDVLNIDFGTSENFKCEITDCLGRAIWNGEVSNQIDVSFLPKGIFYLSAQVDGQDVVILFTK